MPEATEIITRRRLYALSAFGLCAWLIATAFAQFQSPAERPGQAELLLLLHLLVLSTCNLALIEAPDRQGRHTRFFRWAVALHPGAIGCGAVALLSGRGVAPSILTVPYVIFAGLLTLHAGQRCLARSQGGPRGFRLSELCVDMGSGFLLVGALWMLIDRLGQPFGNFSPMIILLTALHFHYAGFTAAVITGLCGRCLAEQTIVGPKFFLFVSFGVISGPIITAIGIAFSPLVEVSGALYFALSMVGLALCLVATAVLPGTPWAGRILLLGAAGGLSLSMGLAVLFAIGEYTGRVSLTIPDMVRTHGVLNAALFGAGATLAFLLIRPHPVCAPPGLPFSRLRAGLLVGPDFFDRRGLIRNEAAVPADAAKGTADATGRNNPRGLCDSLESFRGRDFDPTLVSGEIRSFYEETADFELLIRAEWSPLFRWPGRLYKLISRRIGQMNFPSGSESPENRMDSRILPIQDEKDGRTNVRAWVRKYRATDEAIYAAAYSQHEYGGRRYMNIAFPYPGGNVSSILQLRHAAAVLPEPDDGNAIVLSSFPIGPEAPGDEGVYFVMGGFGIRLPVNETITVRDRKGGVEVEPPGTAATTLLALHEMYLFGVRFLTLHYFIQRAQTLPPKVSSGRGSQAAATDPSPPAQRTL